MARPKKSSYLTDKELRWFDLDKYDDLEGAVVSKWAQVIYDRASLALLAETGRHEKSVHDFVVERFEQIKVAPLAPLGFGQTWNKQHQQDTARVRLLTWNVIEGLQAYAPCQESPGRLEPTVDAELLSSEPLLAKRFAHLTIDLAGTDIDIKNDFDRWLMGWREQTATQVTQGNYLSTKLDQWRLGNFIPFYDLDFFARLQGKNIANEQYRDLLCLYLAIVPLKSQMDTLRRRINSVVSFSTWETLLG